MNTKVKSFLTNITCKLFNHDFPPYPNRPLSLLDDYIWYKCSRCGQSGFGKDPFACFGGKEKFFAENRAPRDLPHHLRSWGWDKYKE
jgi:hypothetical protein